MFFYKILAEIMEMRTNMNTQLIADGITLYNTEKWEQNICIKGILFDMDGLILDTEKLYTRFWQEAANALGYPMTKEQAMGLRSLNKEIGAAKLKSYFDRPIDYEAVRTKRVELMSAYIDENGVEAKPGIVELLTFLKEKGIKTAIATSSPIERTIKYLTSVGLKDSFDELISGYMVKNGKPYPDIYLLAAEKLGLRPNECLALEDSPSGILSGSRAGCYPIMIPDQDEPTEETEKILFAKVDSLEKIIVLLKWLEK